MAKSTEDTTRYVHTEVKNPELVQRRRRQLVDAVVELFIKNGFHKTTTREMAKAAGFSIGTLYEYVKSKEDVLYLVCQAIHQEMESRLTARLSGIGSGAEALKTAIATYFRVCSEMSSHILLIYQETKSLPQESMRFVLEHDVRITGIFAGIIQDGVAGGFFKPLDKAGVDLMAHNIVVLGHMWTFRRWSLSKSYSLEEYTEQQQALIMGELI